MSARLHTPTAAELNKALADLVQKSPNLTPIQARAQLLKSNAKWNIPERRVAKFWKRQQRVAAGEKVANMTDEDSVVSPNVAAASRKSRVIFGFLGRKANASVNKGSAPTRQPESAPIAISVPSKAPAEVVPVPKLEEEPVEEAVEELITTQEVAETEVAPVEDAAVVSTKEMVVDTETAYKDDNDGKRDLMCAPCEGCAIL